MGIDNRIADTEKPFNARLAGRRVPDPLNLGQWIICTASIRTDSLAQLLARHTIDDVQYAAGRWLQQKYEVAQIGALKAIEIRDYVDGRGQSTEFLTDVQRNAVKLIQSSIDVLGKHEYRVISAILLDGATWREMTIGRQRHEKEKITRWLRRQFDKLAFEFGFSSSAVKQRKSKVENKPR